MKKRRYIQIGWGLVLTTLLLGLILAPVNSSQAGAKETNAALDTNAVDANIYIPTTVLTPAFQKRITEQVPGAVNSAINSMVASLPAAQRNMGSQMAHALLQPSAKLLSMTPQQDGMVVTLQLSLYSGDPKPITASVLVKFDAVDGSTVQINGQPVAGSPTLVNGALAKFQIPFGQLKGINVSPSCGDSGLAVNLLFPLSLGQTAQQDSAGKTTTSLAIPQQPGNMQRAAAVDANAYVELPASSLAIVGQGIGTLQVNNNITAKNIKIAVQNDQLVITSDIYLNSFLALGKATTYAQPLASNGTLALHVIRTNMTVFRVFTFPMDTYNRQIEQNVNGKLNGALAGKFNVLDAAIGSNSHIPCAASDSLILTGTTNMGL